MEKYFENKRQLINFLVEDMQLDEDDAENCTVDLYCKEEFREGYHYNGNNIHGYILDTKTNYYYSLSYYQDYTWGSSDFYLDTTPLEMKEETKTITVKKFVPIKEESTND